MYGLSSRIQLGFKRLIFAPTSLKYKGAKEDETDQNKNIDQDIFITRTKNEFGYKGAREASELLSRASALFAGGELDNDAKELLIRKGLTAFHALSA